MTAPAPDVTSSFTADDVRIRDVQRFYAKVIADADTLFAGLNARNMDPDTLAELVDFKDRADANADTVEERHGRIRDAVEEAAHAAEMDTYRPR